MAGFFSDPEGAQIAVAIIGFAGVILTLLFNGWQARKLENHKIELQAKHLRTALVAELTSAWVSINALADGAAKSKREEDFFLVQKNGTQFLERVLARYRCKFTRRLIKIYGMATNTFFQRLKYVRTLIPFRRNL